MEEYNYDIRSALTISQVKYFIHGVCDCINVFGFIKEVLKSYRLFKTYLLCLFLNLVIMLGVSVLLDYVISTLLHLLDLAHYTSALTVVEFIFWQIPLYCLSLPINSIWLAEMFEEVYAKHYKNQRQGVAYRTWIHRLADAASQIILQTIFMLLSKVVFYLPLLVTWALPTVVGNALNAASQSLSFLMEAWLYAFYSYSFRLDCMNVPLTRKVDYIEKTWSYFLGYGLPPVALMLYVATCCGVFASFVVYHFLIPVTAIHSILAHPERPSPHTKLPIFYHSNLFLQNVVHPLLWHVIPKMSSAKAPTQSRQPAGEVKAG